MAGKKPHRGKADFQKTASRTSANEAGLNRVDSLDEVPEEYRGQYYETPVSRDGIKRVIGCVYGGLPEAPLIIDGKQIDREDYAYKIVNEAFDRFCVANPPPSNSYVKDVLQAASGHFEEGAACLFGQGRNDFHYFSPIKAELKKHPQDPDNPIHVEEFGNDPGLPEELRGKGFEFSMEQEVKYINAFMGRIKAAVDNIPDDPKGRKQYPIYKDVLIAHLFKCFLILYDVEEPKVSRYGTLHTFVWECLKEAIFPSAHADKAPTIKVSDQEYRIKKEGQEEAVFKILREISKAHKASTS